MAVSSPGGLRGTLRPSSGGLNVDMRLLGYPELQQKFRDLPVVLRRKIVRQASRDVVKVWRAAAAAEARALTNPQNDSKRMIAVARTLTVRAIKRSRRFVGVRLLTAERSRLGIKADSPGYYPAHVHLGRRVKSLQGVKKRAFEERRSKIGIHAYRIPPRPYLRGPLMVHGAEWRQLLGTLIRDGMEREAAAKKIVLPPELE